MMSRLGLSLDLVLVAALVLGSQIGCARQEAPAPVVLHGQPDEVGAAPPDHAPPTASASPRHRASPSATARVAESPVQAHPDKVRVADGDTLWSISRRYGVPVRTIIDANQLKPPYRVASGAVLVLPQVRQHIVKPGETLYSISRLYGVDISTLVRLNHLDAPYYAKLDVALIIPPPNQGSQVAAARAVLAPAPAPPLPAPPKPVPPSPAPSSAAAPPPTAPAGGQASAAAPEVPLPPVKPARGAPSASPEPAAVQASRPGQIAALPPPPPVSGGKGFVWPVEGRVVVGYGEGPGGTHNDGINIAAPLGTPVLAAQSGVVAYTGNELRGYGNLVLIKHADDWMTAYAHNGAVLVKRGETVKRGQLIARVGTTGGVTEPQLHFEMRRGTHALDPTGYLPAARATAADD